MGLLLTKRSAISTRVRARGVVAGDGAGSSMCHAGVTLGFALPGPLATRPAHRRAIRTCASSELVGASNYGPAISANAGAGTGLLARPLARSRLIAARARSWSDR